MLLPSGFKHLTQWLRNIQFLCEVSEWMQLAVPVMIFLFRAKKGKKAKWAGSVHPCFLSISQSLLTDLYAGTHTHRCTHCRCCCWFSSVCICLPWSDTSQPYSWLQVRLRNWVASLSTSVIGSYSLVKKELGKECQVRKRLDSVCHRCQLFRLFAINKYVSFQNQINTHCRDCQCQFMGK